MDLISLICPAPRNGGFKLDDYWVWCGSAIRGEDGRYHLFASRWPTTYPMHPGWTFASEIVRASADTPEGPYAFEEVVLKQRDSTYFDGKVTHNPTIHKSGDTYLLFYTGTTYEGEISPEQMAAGGTALYEEVWNRKRVGLATSKSVFGPWKRSDQPVLLPRPGHWDEMITSNPAPCVAPDGSIYLVYKSCRDKGVRQGPFHLGLAKAKDFNSKFERLVDGPLFDFGDPSKFVEDPYLWHADGQFHIIMKDMTGAICGESHAGIYLSSEDCIHWDLSKARKAYSRNVLWDDGQRKVMGSFERPQLLIQDGVPTHLFAATADGVGGFWKASTTWNMVTPLARYKPA